MEPEKVTYGKKPERRGSDPEWEGSNAPCVPQGGRSGFCRSALAAASPAPKQGGPELICISTTLFFFFFFFFFSPGFYLSIFFFGILFFFFFFGGAGRRGSWGLGKISGILNDLSPSWKRGNPIPLPPRKKKSKGIIYN